MGRLREIPRTAAFAWSQDIARPFVATGTRAGAVDADFSDETKLELWDLSLGDSSAGPDLQPLSSLSTDSRFFDIAWSPPSETYKSGIIAGALENGALDLWDAEKLKQNATDALISRTEKHAGSIKALQFNPHKPELLASCGAKGELYITDLNNAANPFRLGGTGARADDFDTLDWNKKVPHILVTGGSGGFVTVWDVKAKKESLTLNNYNRKPVSAVAWNPEEPTRLATATSYDQEPVVLLWNLRNSSAPEMILRGHEEGVLSLSWCAHDNNLLLSCGKDNRNICWDLKTGKPAGEFPIVTNWTFQTRWNPKHPNLLATASFDGKIGISSIQNTQQTDPGATAINAAGDGADFFDKAQTQPQGSSFSLATPPKWLKRPVSVAFGFGGKIISLSPIDGDMTKSKVKISTFKGDEKVDASITQFQSAMNQSDFSSLCNSKISSSDNEQSKNDWKVIQTLLSENPRKGLLTYLGFEDTPDAAAEAFGEGAQNEPDSLQVNASTNGVSDTKENRLSAFFDNAGENQNFLADLAASKGARTNNPFSIFTGSEKDADKQITRAIMMGRFEDALDICLKEDRMSDAFMIAICGGQKCIDKAQAAYFGQQSNGPNYLRLLASVVGKNLWDVVYNADLENWSEVMATLCTFADAKDFPDLCEALGDRLDEMPKHGKDASFCYLAGSKLEKVVPLWLKEMQEVETARSNDAGDESAFSVHVQALQVFIEKVSIFRSVTKYVDNDAREQSTNWKLEPLYSKYAEYADVVASYGYLDLAQQFLSLLPTQYPAADVARNRVQQAGQKAPTATLAQKRTATPLGYGAQQVQGLGTAPATNNFVPVSNQMSATPTANSAYNPAGGASRYAAPGYQSAYSQPSSSAYGPNSSVGGYGAPASNIYSVPPPGGPSEISTPPKAPPAANGTNWNDLPESFERKPTPSRRGTPSAYAPFPAQIQSSQYGVPPPQNSFQQAQQRTQTPLAPPPRAGSSGPPRIGSPPVNNVTSSLDPTQRPPSAAATSYAPTQQMQQAPPQNLGPASVPIRANSPYNPPPAGGAPSSRYAPAPGAPGQAPAGMSGPPGMGRSIAPFPYGNPVGMQPQQQQQQQQQQPFSHAQQQAPPPRASAPPSAPPPMSRGPPASGHVPTASTGASSQPSTAASQGSSTRFPTGDRSHIPPEAQPIYDILHSEMQRIKGRAPANFRPQVEDTEKRLNLLFDQLNNDDLKAENVALLKQLAQAMQARNFDAAQALQTDLMKAVENGGPWLVGIKRLISMSRATPVS